MGLTFDKLLVILVIAVFVVGPERLPGYAKKLGELVRNLRRMADGAKDRLRDEMGPEFDDVDWRQLDPRQYDPRRIIRDALEDDGESAALREAQRRRSAARPAGAADGLGAAGAAGAAAFGGSGAVSGADAATAELYFDDEAT